MNLSFALVGNPNCGKTTLFNALTGAHQKVGNWTGVTVQEKVGQYKKDKSIKIIDLPGAYSLTSTATDEYQTKKFLLKNPPSAIINIVDGTNLERNLSLTLELCSLNLPMVIAVNMADELEKNNVKFNAEKLSEMLGVPVICVSALKNKNVDNLMDFAKNFAKKPKNIMEQSKNNGWTSQNKYEFIEQITHAVITKKSLKSELITQKVDDILLHKFFGIPIFFGVIFFVYFLSIKIGAYFGGKLSTSLSQFGVFAVQTLKNNGVSSWLISLIDQAIIGSLSGIISFLPQILVLFALMAVIEQCGYASRIAFLTDRFFRSFGLGGKSLLPMLVSCGCTVTGIMATRTIERTNERRMTIFLCPFMPCGAKTAVFAWFSSAFFDGSALVATSMYFLGVICVGVFGRILRNFKPFSERDGGFLMEMPTLRSPAIKDVFFVLVEKVKEFITKAGLIVFCVSVFLWLFKSVGVTGYVGNEIEKSFLYSAGNLLKYILYPLGVSGWQASVALISGAFAKEAVVETLNLICADAGSLFANKFSAYAFMAFILLSPPCVGSLVTAKQELGGTKWFIFMIIFQTITAYAVAIIINAVGNIFIYKKGLILSTFIGIIILISLILAIKKLGKRKCKLCKSCKGEILCRKEERFTI